MVGMVERSGPSGGHWSGPRVTGPTLSGVKLPRIVLAGLVAGAGFALSGCHGDQPTPAQGKASIILVTAQTTAPPTAAPSTFGQEADGGWLSAPVSPFDTSSLAVIRLDPALLRAVQEAANSAVGDGIKLVITSGWRSRAFQQQLLDEAVQKYGSLAVARQWVATPDESHHVLGRAVDIGPVGAYDWMIHNGPRFGLCQIYANEKWHFELATDADGVCPPLLTNAAG